MKTYTPTASRRGLLAALSGAAIAGGAYGTFQVLDTLASSQQSIAQYGEDRAFQEIDAARAAINRIAQEMLGDLVEKTTDRQRRYGSSDAMTLEAQDEYGRPQAQKVVAGSTVGFPLYAFGIGLQWTRLAFEVMTVQEMNAQVSAAFTAYLNGLTREIKRALFNPTNYTFVDNRVDNVSLAVKRLVNADSAAIPLGPNGESFTVSSHTHYNYTASTSLAAADLAANIEDVVEHFRQGAPVVYINRAQETAVRGLTGFTADLPITLRPADNVQTTFGNLDQMNLYDRRIGVFYSAGVFAPVVVKPWVPAGYVFTFMEGAPVPVVMRERASGRGDLRLAFMDERYPLRAQGWDAEFGMGVFQRTNGAILYIDSGSAGAYVAPTIS